MIEERNEKKGVAPYLLLLLLTTVLWGIGFVVTEQLTQNNVPVFMLFAIQFAIGAFCLAWFAFFGKKDLADLTSTIMADCEVLEKDDKRLAFGTFAGSRLGA